MKIAALLLATCLLVPLPVPAQRLKLSVSLDRLEAAARADSNDAMAHYNLALGYWSKARWDDVARELDACLALEPRFAMAYLAKAHLPFARRPKLWNDILEDEVPLSELPLVQQMDRDYRRAFFFDPMVDLRIISAVIPPKSYLWQADPYLSQLYEVWVQGFEDIQRGDHASAYRRFERMADAYTATGRTTVDRIPAVILWYQGLAAAKLGMRETAIRNVREVLRRAEAVESGAQKAEDLLAYSPLRANEYRYALGMLLVQSGELAEARAQFAKAVEADLGFYMAHVAAAYTYEQQGDLASAVRERRAALAANPEDPSSAIELAITLAQTGNRDEVEALLAEVARTNPRHARAHYLLGSVRHQLGQHAAAKAALEHFLRIAPSGNAKEIADAKRRLAEL